MSFLVFLQLTLYRAECKPVKLQGPLFDLRDRKRHRCHGNTKLKEVKDAL